MIRVRTGWSRSPNHLVSESSLHGTQEWSGRSCPGIADRFRTQSPSRLSGRPAWRRCRRSRTASSPRAVVKCSRIRGEASPKNWIVGRYPVGWSQATGRLTSTQMASPKDSRPAAARDPVACGSCSSTSPSRSDRNPTRSSDFPIPRAAQSSEASSRPSQVTRFQPGFNCTVPSAGRRRTLPFDSSVSA